MLAASPVRALVVGRQQIKHARISPRVDFFCWRVVTSGSQRVRAETSSPRLLVSIDLKWSSGTEIEPWYGGIIRKLPSPGSSPDASGSSP